MTARVTDQLSEPSSYTFMVLVISYSVGFGIFLGWAWIWDAVGLVEFDVRRMMVMMMRDGVRWTWQSWQVVV